MFTLQIQVESSDELSKIAVITELLLSQWHERDLTDETVAVALDWLFDSFNDYLSSGTNVNPDVYLCLVARCHQLIEKIQDSIKED